MKNANNKFSQFTGTENWHKLMMNHTATDGVMHVCNELKCYWFIDVILSYQMEEKLRGEDFQTWKLKRTEGDKFIAEATDGNDNILVMQEIDFSDFKYDELTLWNVNRTIMLPSEY